MQPQTEKSKKPPACDACKARKILCHSRPNDLPCHRCAEKGIACKTTYVPRGRPRKDAQPVEKSTIAISDDLKTLACHPSQHNSLAIVARPGDLELSAFWEIPCELVKDLFQCLDGLFQSYHPLFRDCRIESAVSSVGWRLDLLSPQACVLAYCVCALASTISFNSAIIGPGPQPESFADKSVFFAGADLRTYGVRRGPMFRALLDRALGLACDTRIQLEASEHNAASCFILDSLDKRTENFSPWAVTYTSHVRSLAGSWSKKEIDEKRGLWAGFLMAEALSATEQRKPILITDTDQLLIAGSEPSSLESLLESLRGGLSTFKRSAAHSVSIALRPIFFHVTRLSRDLYAKITGDYARRSPISETAVVNVLSALTILQSITSLLFSEDDLQLDHQKSLSPDDRRNYEEARKAVSAMCMGFAGLALALHNEMQYRAATDTSGVSRNDWAQQRAALLRQQAHSIASSALDELDRGLVVLSIDTMPHIIIKHMHWGNIPGWAQFCLDEADAAGGIPPTRIAVFERLVDMLKLLGYSQDGPQFRTLVERMDAHIAVHRAAASGLFPTQPPGLPGVWFPPAETWMEFLSVDNALTG
ncbi:hypothetical protein C8R43DRAFT_1035064 [Mycena crocata]|nr:hypothetical protein C8R43DRAFT_1035064 [Mycena crocata]